MDTQVETLACQDCGAEITVGDCYLGPPLCYVHRAWRRHLGQFSTWTASAATLRGKYDH